MTMKQHGAPATAGLVMWRFATGQHLDGRKRSDATFLTRGTYADPHWWGRGGDSGWAIRPGWQRAAARWAAVAVLAGLLRWRTVTLWVLVLTVAPAVGVYLALGFRRWQEWEHYRTKTKPLHFALAPVLDMPAATRPREWLDVPSDYAERDDAEIIVYPPDQFTGSTRDREDIERGVTAKLGIEAPDVEYRLGGIKPRIVFTKSEPPPLTVTLSDVRPRIEAADPSTVVLGLGKKAQVIDVKLDSETPHVGLSMTTGDGKSTVAQNAGAQMAYHGAVLVFLDYKLFSHMWARGLPNVSYAGTPAEIHEVLCWMAADDYDDEGNVIRESELTRRKRVGLASADLGGNVHANLGPRLFIIAEELNATQKQLKKYWRRIGGKGPSPASEALDEVLFTGRQLLVNALFIGQRLSARATGSDGSADARENVGTIVTKDPTESTWKMLANGHAQPPASGHKGRYQMISRKEVREMQGVLFDPDPLVAAQLARDLAMAGTVAQPRFDMPCVWRPSPGGVLVPAGIGQAAAGDMGTSEQGFVSSHTDPVLTPGTGPRDAVKLAEAVAAGLFVSIAAARKAANRQGWEPVGGERYTGYEYALADIYEYTQARKK